MTTFALPFVPAAPRTGFGRIAQAAHAFRAHRRTQRALNELDAHLLRDIGLIPQQQETTDKLMFMMRSQW